MSAFEQDSAVERTGDDSFRAEVRDGWDIAGNANGGYLLAIAARALTQTSGYPHPASITAHYLAPGRPGPVAVHTERHRKGGSFATSSARVLRGDRPILAVLGSFTTLPERAEEAAEGERITDRVDAKPPELPAPEDCVATSAGPIEGFGFNQKVDLRLHPGDDFRSAPSGEPRMRGWFRWPDEAPIDVMSLMVAVDAFPPTIFNARLPIAWTPTLELTAHVRAQPVPGWLRCQFTTRFISGGFLEEDGEVWDSSGRLVAQSRQLALLPKAR